MAIIKGSTPKQDGFRMPGEFEEQDGVFMLWPYRPDCWRDNALPAKKAFADVALAISEFEPVMVLAKEELIEEACNIISEKGGARGYAISVAPCKSNDAWVRDCGPTFVIDDSGNIRACDWEFNAWGGDFDGL